LKFYKTIAPNNKVGCPCKQANVQCVRNTLESGDGFPPKYTCHCYDDITYTSLIDLIADEGHSFCNLKCQIQSAEADTLDANATMASDSVQEQILGFIDDKPGVDMDIAQPLSRTKPDSSFNADLGDFLKRPTLIHEFSWTEGTSISLTTIDPWTLFFSNPTIVKKLDNYAFLRCNLKLKFVINASPFYYGGLLMSYQPLSAFNPAPIVTGSNLELISLSQRPNITLYPQNCQGGTMTLPFVYYKQYVPITASDVAELGRLQRMSYGDLLNANSVVGSNCDVSIYAWAEDLELVAPTVLDAMQSGEISRSKVNKSKGKKDEYSHEGTISKPASAIARASGLLGNIPVIGPFMTATSMAADAVSGIASIFGYTNVPVIDDVHYFKNSTLPHLAATDIGNPVDKLALDSKNELSIDPAISGVALEDELNIAKFCSRESFLVDFDWTSVRVPGDMLMNVAVTPVLHRYASVTGGEVVYPTPMYMVSSVFNYWRGDIIFRFKILCSQYHKGRLEFNWSPTGTPATAGNTTNQIYTKIVDITKNNDVEFRVPYIQDTSYKQINVFTTSTLLSDTVAINGTSTNVNGVLSVKVVNKQTSPVASADIKILMYVKGSDNLEFAAPTEIDSRQTLYAIQSNEVDYDTTCQSMNIGVKDSSPDPNLNLIYHGEKVVSLRTLNNRSAYLYSIANRTIPAGVTFVTKSVIPRFPYIPGFDPNGIHEAVGAISGVTEKYNFVNWHPSTWFASCFIGHRGSMNFHVNAGIEVSRMTISRERETLGAGLDDQVFNLVDSGRSNSYKTAFLQLTQSTGTSGLTFTNPNTQNCASANVPLYSRFKFLSNNVATRTLGSPVDESNRDNVTIICTGLTPDIIYNDYRDVYVAGGPDLSFVFFLNAPAIWRLTTIPTAV